MYNRMLLLFVLMVVGCGQSPTQSVEDVTSPDYASSPALTKPVVGGASEKHISLLSIELSKTIEGTSYYTAIADATVRISRSISGRDPEWSKAITDKFGDALIKLDTDSGGRFRNSGVAGLYRIQVIDQAGVMLAEWGSYPVNGGDLLIITIGSQGPDIETRDLNIQGYASFAVYEHDVIRTYDGSSNGVAGYLFSVFFSAGRKEVSVSITFREGSERFAIGRRGTGGVFIDANPSSRSVVLTEWSGELSVTHLTTSVFEGRTVTFSLNPDGSVSVVDDGL